MQVPLRKCSHSVRGYIWGGVDGGIYKLAYAASRSSNEGTIESECKAFMAMRAAKHAKDTLATRFLADIIAVALVLHLLL